LGIQILANPEHGAVFYSSSTDWAFGPVMRDEEVAEAFLRWLPDDPRMMADNVLEQRWLDFQRKLICPEGHPNAAVTTFGDGLTHFYCAKRDCKQVWDVDGNSVTEDEEDPF
jgi:hypothetical protein